MLVRVQMLVVCWMVQMLEMNGADGVAVGDVDGEVVDGLLINGKIVSLNLTCLLTNVFWVVRS